MLEKEVPPKPLQGVRVLEAAIQYSAPYPMKLLAHMGAEVIKLEGMARPCGLRQTGMYPDNDPGADPWNRCGYFNEVNTGKYGIAVDLAQPEGQEIFKALVRRSDVVIENFTPRVLKKFGLDYERLVDVKPDIIMASCTGFGQTGPWSNYTAYGMNVEALSGAVAVTGYPGGTPVRCGMAYIDDIAALHAAFAVLSALEYRDRAGKGQRIDVAMYEGGSVVPEAVLEYQMTGQAPPRIGNRHRHLAPHGLYPCDGNDTWVAISVETDEDWQALCAAMGAEDLARDERFLGVRSRWANQDELDAPISAWTRTKTPREVAELLQSRGVAAGPVMTTGDLLCSPHLRERRFFQVVDHADRGEHRVGARPYPTVPWRLSRNPQGFERPAPALGQHNHYVLHDLLGYDEALIEQLEQKRVIGSVPDKHAIHTPPVPDFRIEIERGRMLRQDPDYADRLSKWLGEKIGS